MHTSMVVFGTCDVSCSTLIYSHCLFVFTLLVESLPSCHTILMHGNCRHAIAFTCSFLNFESGPNHNLMIL